MNKKLYRDEYHKVLGGVCSGLAQYFDMDVTIVRLLFALTFFIMGAGLGTYIILWIVLPRKGSMYFNPTVDYTVPPQEPGSPFNPGPGSFGNNPFNNNPYTSTPYGNNPYQAGPVNTLPPKKSHAGIIVGIVLIFIGGAILVDEYDLIPDFDFDRIWPVALVLVGAALIVSGQTKRPWEKEWNKNAVTGESVAEAEASEDETTTL